MKAIAVSVILLVTAATAQAQDTNWSLDAETGVPLDFAASAAAQQLSLLPQTSTFRFNTNDEFYDKRKYTDDFRIKGVRIGDGVYFGEAKIAGEKGPGIVVERGDLYWGFNHRGAEVLYRF